VIGSVIATSALPQWDLDGCFFTGGVHSPGAVDTSTVQVS